jgi:hypothetical protein
MTDFDYKKYSLEHLENWLHDAISSGEASPQEVYDTIKKVVEEEYYHYKNGASKTNELLALLNGEGKGHIQAYDDHIHFNVDPAINVLEDSTNPWYDYYSDMNGDGYTMSADGFCIPPGKEDKVVKWMLPVQQEYTIDNDGEYFVNFPDDLLKAANLKEGDQIEWVDNNDGTYTLRKVNAE